MNTKKIKKILVDQELTITDLAKLIKFSREHTSNTIHNRSKSAEAQRRIYKVLGLKAA